MIVKSQCPVCGVYSTVYVTLKELQKYIEKDILPNDFTVRSICRCCRDDGYIISKETEYSNDLTHY